MKWTLPIGGPHPAPFGPQYPLRPLRRRTAPCQRSSSPDASPAGHTSIASPQSRDPLPPSAERTPFWGSGSPDYTPPQQTAGQRRI